MSDNRYVELCESVTDEENLQVRLIDGMGQDNILEFRFFAAADRAGNASELAQAEQMRIANLLALASFQPRMFPLLTLEHRAWALEEAMKALGVPE